MNLYKSVLFPLLKKTDPEHAHERAARALRLAQSNPAGRLVLRAVAGRLPQTPVEFCGLRFPNVLGIAAGFDKDVQIAPGLAALGFGHVEVGTLTPRPQPGNPRPRIFRLPEDQAIINRMGFPNQGVQAVLPRLRRIRRSSRQWILGVSLGKQKTTPLDEAAADYIDVMQSAYPFADYLAVNISSPNTPGLRELQGGRYLQNLLETLVAERDRLAARHNVRRPLLVKIAPDLALDELDQILAAIDHAHIDAVIATNTTLSRDGLGQHPHQHETGGLSGRPLTGLSTRIIRHINAVTAGRLPIIGVGGIFDADDVRAKLDAGASLVQVYTGFVYEGPAMAGRILRTLPASRT